MSDTLSSSLLGEVLGHALQEAAFTFVEPVDSLPEEASEVYQARLTVYGAGTSELVLACGAEFAETLAANLLGVDVGDEAAVGKGIDALGELLNIVAGILLDRDVGGPVPLKIGTPDVRCLSMSEHLGYVKGASSRGLFQSDDGHWIDIASIGKAQG